MKLKHLLFSSLLLLSAGTAWADVTINEANFPDANFRNYLLSQNYGNDGVLTDEEIAGVFIMDVSSKEIQSIQGIEYFTALYYLSCNNNQLTSLDVSKCGVLTILVCWNNQLTSLDVSGCKRLTEIYCYQNKIKGKSMDALIESLPTVSSGKMYVTYYENEQNVMTTTQVAAAKTKGWIPYYTDGTTNILGLVWYEYPGIDPSTGVNNVKAEAADSAPWYTINGTQLSGKPTEKGIYIHSGKKVLVK